MGLLSSRLDLQNSNYILVPHALEILANETSEPLSMAVAFLYNHDFYEEVPTFRKTDTGKIIYDDDSYGGVFSKTWEILGYFDKANPHHFYESGYRESYWLKSDFFNFLIENEITHIPSVINWLASNPSEPQASEIKPHDDPMELGENQKLIRYFEIFTPHDLACFIVDYNPAYNQNDDDFNKAYLLVNKAVSAGVLKPNAQNEIPKEQVKEYLKSLDWIYKGFNDNLPPAPADKIGHATITQTPPTDPELSQQIADLNAQLASLKADNDRLTIENQQQAQTILQLNEALAGKSDTPADTISEPLKGIAKVNHDKDRAKTFACVVAKFLWDMDTEKRIRTGKMANHIYALVHEFDSKATTQRPENVKEWIKSIAPDYAKKGGNEPKDPPPIILTLKN